MLTTDEASPRLALRRMQRELQHIIRDVIRIKEEAEQSRRRLARKMARIQHIEQKIERLRREAARR